MSSAKQFNSKKRSKKYYCNQNNKKRKLEGLEPGLKGFLITCNDKKEAPTISEAYMLLNEYADELYGPEKLAENAKEESGEEESGEEESIEKALSKEITGLKESVRNRRFKSVKTKVKNVLFIKTSLSDPNELVNSIFEDLEKTRTKKTRRCMKFIPVRTTCYASVESILLNSKKMFEDYFTSNRSEGTFCIVFKSRCNNKMKRDDLIPEIAKIIGELNDDWRVQYKSPEYTVVVDIIANVCLLGILKDFDRFRKYNLQSMTEEKQTEETDTTSEAQDEETTNKETKEEETKEEEAKEEETEEEAKEEETKEEETKEEVTKEEETKEETKKEQTKEEQTNEEQTKEEQTKNN